MEKVYRGLWKIIVFLVGFSVTIIGLILIPLPGPGILVTFIGLTILALEFEWAERHRDRVKDATIKLKEKAFKRPPDKT